MGNYVSCTLSCPIRGKHSKCTKVILPTGDIRQLQEPTKAAELMLELDSPNYFLVNSKTLQIGQRFSALNADEDLEMGVVYVMFHMKRVNSFVNAADLGSVYIVAKSAARSGSIGNVRISPESAGADDYSALADQAVESAAAGAALKLNLDDIEDFSLPEFKHRLSLCRSKKPLLETIAEESGYSKLPTQRAI